ncbi:MAG: pyridoxal-phosphate dependent enzyme, partial [Chitinispirillaceae bacterium]|nr:pyridoxal-phosphate dependent enzyme [Chitinispirillaceae bacterium]
LREIGMLKEVETKIYGAQATGCSPISTAFKKGTDVIKPVKPNTVAKSLAIGNPADGYYALQAVKESGGAMEDVSDEEIVEAIKILAKTEGIFAETAGGVTLATYIKLLKEGKIDKKDSTVLCITGNGLKTSEVLNGRTTEIYYIKPNLASFEETLSRINKKEGR